MFGSAVLASTFSTALWGCVRCLDKVKGPLCLRLGLIELCQNAEAVGCQIINNLSSYTGMPTYEWVQILVCANRLLDVLASWQKRPAFGSHGSACLSEVAPSSVGDVQLVGPARDRELVQEASAAGRQGKQTIGIRW